MDLLFIKNSKYLAVSKCVASTRKHERAQRKTKAGTTQQADRTCKSVVPQLSVMANFRLERRMREDQSDTDGRLVLSGAPTSARITDPESTQNQGPISC